MRNRQMRKPNDVQFDNWTPQHDSYLIENNDLTMDILKQTLPFSDEEIMARRKVLGLVTRIRQLKKLRHF